MKLGALDYLQKPFEIDELLVVVRRALEHQRLRTEYRYLRSERDEQFDHYGIVGRSRAMEEIIQRAERVAETKSTVLITGETGTGKELVARAIHDRSAQRDMPLIKVNCAAIPETLLESELFGHVRGAFTGATDDEEGQVRAGRRRHDLPRRDRHDDARRCRRSCCACCRSASSSRSASERTERVDVRVIAATNRDLRQMVADGKFQEDLFYRLNVIPIELPPLRERREDIPALVEHFVAQARAADRPARSSGSRTACWRRCSSTTGRATCASSRTRSSAPSCSRPGPVDHRAAPSRCSAPSTPQTTRPAVAEAAAEHRVGRARDDPARARERRAA